LRSGFLYRTAAFDLTRIGATIGDTDVCIFRSSSVLLPNHKPEAILKTGMIFDIKRFAIHDGPGVRTTIFMKGCSLTCICCHNPESQSPEKELLYRNNLCRLCEDCASSCDSGALHYEDNGLVVDKRLCEQCGSCAENCFTEALTLVGRNYSVSQLIKIIEKDSIFFDESDGGATFSGGEPLLQADFLNDVLAICKEMDISTAVDTSGYAKWDTIKMISGNTDLFLYDLKMMDDTRHKRFTGVSNRRILDNLKRLSEMDQTCIIRLPIFPGLNDDDKNISMTGEFISSLAGSHRIELLPYHKVGLDKYCKIFRLERPPELAPLEEERADEIASMLRRFGLQVFKGDKPHGNE